MDWKLLLSVWLITGLPFIISNVVVILKLFTSNLLLQDVYLIKDTKEIKKQLNLIRGYLKLLPFWFGYLLLSQLVVILSIIDGLLWITHPYRQLKKVYNVLRWNFKEL